jgi:methionyl-tRNA formyltransferase
VFALPSLEALCAAGHDVTLVVTQPDRPAGRGQKPTPSPLAAYARAHSLSLWQTSSLRGLEAEERLREAGPEAMALAAFAALVPENVLRLTASGILNVHPSLLPRWRGAAPIQAALLAGDAQTGVSIIRLVKELDAGPVLLREATPIQAEDDYLTLEAKLAELGARLLVRAFAEQPLAADQDPAGATFAPKIERGEGLIDWTHPAVLIWRKVRAYRGWPQAFTTFAGLQLKVLRAAPVSEPTADANVGLAHEARPSREAGPSDSGALESSAAGRSKRLVNRIFECSASRASEGLPHNRDDGNSAISPPGEEQVPPGTVHVERGVPYVRTGDGWLRLDLIQLQGKRPVTGAEFLRGYPQLNGAAMA